MKGGLIKSFKLPWEDKRRTVPKFWSQISFRLRVESDRNDPPPTLNSDFLFAWPQFSSRSHEPFSTGSSANSLPSDRSSRGSAGGTRLKDGCIDLFDWTVWCTDLTIGSLTADRLTLIDRSALNWMGALTKHAV